MMDFIDEAAMSEMMNALRLMTRRAYALQHLRIQTGLRLCANFRDKLKESVEEEETEDREEQFRQLNMFKRRRQRGEKPAPAPE